MLIYSIFLSSILINQDPEVTDDCTWNGIPLHGDVQIVESFPDIKVKVVDSFPDLNVQIVDNFADDCGEWEFVDSFPDFTIQYVDSFPDIKFAHESLNQQGPHMVVVEKAQASGTHTGTAYCPMPGKVEPIETSGKHIVVDEERWFFELQDGKLKSFSVVALGPCTGPAGLYERLKNTLEMEKEAAKAES